MKSYISMFTSPAYWKYAIFSKPGAQAVLAFYGAIWLVVETLDFFNVYTRDRYGSYAFLVLIAVSALLTIIFRLPVRCISIFLRESDVKIQVKFADIFDASGAVAVSTNTSFECDVASSLISSSSLQGQFTAKYYTGDQSALVSAVEEELLGHKGPPYLMGTTVSVTTHGKTFYLVAMSDLNSSGNASTTIDSVKEALDGLWKHVRDSGELQELSVPVIGTARGRLKEPRKKVIELIAESFARASRDGKFCERLIITIHPDDAKKYGINLHETKDHLRHTLTGIH